MAHQVFICYASRDRDIADAVCTALESRQIKCWIAPRDVFAGADWAETIVDAIDGSRFLILVLSSSSNSSPQVIREVGRAANNGIPIIPFRIDDVTPSKSMDYFISRHQFLDALTPPLEKHLPRLVDTVQMILTRETEERAKKEEEARKAKEAEERAKKEQEARKAKEAEERANKEEEARKAEEAEQDRRAKEAEEARRGKEVEERAKKEQEARKAKEAEERANKEEEARKAEEAEQDRRAKEAEEKMRREFAKAPQQVSYCPKCGVELRPKAIFCHKCGTLVSKGEKAK